MLRSPQPDPADDQTAQPLPRTPHHELTTSFIPAKPPPESPALWSAPQAQAPIRATVQLPGSKSLTNRYLILAALANSPSIIRSPLVSRDSWLMIEALRHLGAQITPCPGTSSPTPDLHVTPIPTSTTQRHATAHPLAIDCGLAGTVMRFVPPVAALSSGAILFDGDPAARLRPMGPLLDACRALGIEVEHRETLPFLLQAHGGVRGGSVTVDASLSSQFVSALLLAAPRFDRGLTLHTTRSALPSPQHLEMTVALLRSVGVTVEHKTPQVWSVQPGGFAGFDVQVEPDLSNAGPFLAAAFITHGTLRIPHWPHHTTQLGDAWPTIFSQWGASIRRVGDDLEITGVESWPGIQLSGTSELTPTIVALCALAQSASSLDGIGHLRGHETDRLSALTREITRLGGDISATATGLSIRPRPLHGGIWSSYADHRMATTGAVLGLKVPGLRVHDITSTEKTLPNFPALWNAMMNGL